MGITRIANVTGLDYVGIPVVMVVRPNSRSLSVAQGKGLSIDAAKAGGVMEAIESYHGEHITQPIKTASFEELRYIHDVVDPLSLSHVSTSSYSHNLSISWIEGVDLVSQREVWLPYEAIHTNFTLPIPGGSGSFVMGSNGVASGNHVLEAISHGICEVIERDSTTLWHLLEEEAQVRTRVDLQTVDDDQCCEILERYREAGIAVAVWDSTSDIGIPAFVCSILEGRERYFPSLYAAAGMGCHPNRGIALCRALTEAAQSRLTLIAGSRDDMFRRRYERARDADALRRSREELLEGRAERSFQEVPNRVHDSIEEDVEWELERITNRGFQRLIVVDLTKEEFRIPVVRVVIPRLEGNHKSAGYVYGQRARARIDEAG
jgi:ribosomal protein S12 methylthiotransferase accessory factor